MSGWIALKRGWFEQGLFDDEPLTQREAWHWLIEKAAWKKCTRRASKGERIEVERGQYHTSLRVLAEAWGWHKNRVARFMDLLTKDGKIGTVAGQSGVLLTICNYDKYQTSRDSHEPESGTVAGRSRDIQEQIQQDIPISKEIGGSDFVDPEKLFWDTAKGFIERSGKSAKQAGALVGKWLRDHGKELTRAAISAAQFERAVDPVSYIEGFFRRHTNQDGPPRQNHEPMRTSAPC